MSQLLDLTKELGITVSGIPDTEDINAPSEKLLSFVNNVLKNTGRGAYTYGDPAPNKLREAAIQSETQQADTQEERQAAIEAANPPETTAGGMAGAMAREAGGPLAATLVGAGLGSVVPGVGTLVGAGVGLAGYGITKAISPAVKALVEKLGGTALDVSELEKAVADSLNIPEADTPAERLAASGTRGAVEAGEFLAGGALMKVGQAALGTGSKLQQIGKVVAESPLKQLVGGALSGVGAEKGVQVAESRNMGKVGSILLPLGLGILGDIAGTGLVAAAQKVNKLIAARGMDLPDAAAEAIRLSQGRGEIFLSDIEPTTSRAESGRSFRETTSGGTQDLRFDRNFKRRQAIYDTMDDFGVVEGDYYARDIIDDFLKKRGDLVSKWKGEKTEVIKRLSHGGMDVGEALPLRDTVGIPDTLEVIRNKMAELSATGDADMQPIINTLANWEQSLNNKNLVQVEYLRKRLRNKFKDPNLAPVKDDGMAIAKEIYDSLNNEMGEYIMRQGGAPDYRKWKTSNEALADMMGDFEISAVQNLIKKGEFTPGLITQFIQNNDREMLETLYDGLSPQGRRTAQASIMADMTKKATDLGDLSPNQFARELDTNEARKVFFSQEDVAQLDGLQKWLEITKRDEFPVSAATRPGSQLPGGQYALARGLWADPRIGLPVALAGRAGLGKFSKWLEQGEVRDLMIKYAAIPDNKIATAGQELAKRLGEMYRGFMSTETSDRVTGSQK